MSTKFKGWFKTNDGGFWSTASITHQADGEFRLTAQEYRSNVTVFLSQKDIKRLRDYLNGVLADG